MAASKKKQDEKHLKILRELVSEPGNKKCAECQQRGPTYVDITMGTFICTTCSGLLRGINPPHRVKSITMTSFSPEEIEKVRNSGNEKCNRVYVGKWTEPRDPGPETMEEMKIKFFLQDKYERRRWYLEPGSEPPKRGGVAAGSNTPETKPLSQLLGSTAPKLIVGTRTDSPASTPPVSRGTPPVSRGTPNLPAPPGVQRKSSQVQQQPFATSVAPEPAAAPKQESLLDLNEAFSAPAPQPSQPFGGQPVFPPASGGGGGFGAFTSFSSAPPPPAAASMPSSSPFGSTSLNAAPPTSLAAAPAMTSAGDKYAAFGSLSSSSSQPQPVSTNVDWSGGINWASGGGGGGGTSTSMMTSTASSADGMSWGAASSQQQQSSAAPSMMSAGGGGGGGGGVSQMNWGVGNAGSMGFSSTTSSAMTWNQPQQPQQQQSAAFSSSNPFGSAAATQQQQQPQSQPQPQLAQGNPFGSFGNIGGTTRGPADATLFNKPQPQQQQQTFVQQQQPGGFVGQQQQQLGGGFAMQQQPQPSMGGFGGAGGGFQQQPGGFPGGGQAGFSAGGFGQQQAFGAQMMGQPQGQSFGGQMGGQFVQAAPVQAQFGGWGGQPQQQSNPFMMGGQPQQQQQQMMGRGGGINPFM
ncbi:arf-GAP domain and FG repeat-containing protein 2-like [Oscarella lobularis]|uniref:arf-GAP domain and FG repeat-containing protein 2-like n=1 Tax=Oscarella lobularis TaxID=121494 RepID=UPI0033136011